VAVAVPGLGQSEQSAADSPGAPLVWGWKQSRDSSVEGRLWLCQSQAGRMRPHRSAGCMQGTVHCPSPCPTLCWSSTPAHTELPARPFSKATSLSSTTPFTGGSFVMFRQPSSRRGMAETVILFCTGTGRSGLHGFILPSTH